MKNKTIKLLTPLLGVIFLFPKIGGIRASASSLEKAKDVEFCVFSPQGEYKFYYPELNLVKGENKEKYYLCQLDEQVEKIVADNTLSAVDATFSFGKNGFTYYPERTGIVCDKNRLKKEIEDSLANPIFDGEKVRFSSVKLKCERCPTKVSVSALKK
ncbi:MAG: peptidoglycan binding domain-containing protein, partial [Clostridia bacterium]|nr:peptidoglycan binding domain-containing protein [Clostridia bacterium]